VALGALGLVLAVALGVMWLRHRREIEIREHGARLTDLYGDVARQAYHIDRDMLRLENALEGLAAAAAWALAGPEPTGEDARIYFDTDFASGNLPDDFTKKTAYRWEVSVQHPVVSVAPGVAREPLLPRIRRLAPLRHHIRQMVIEAAVEDATKIAPEQATALLVGRESPIDYAYVDLPDGIHVVWPGMASLRSDYDVRTSSFYVDTVNTRGRKWGAPYIDSTTDRRGDDLVLPCTKAVWSPTGEFLGVAGVEMTVTKMVTTTMKMDTRTTLRASLVDKAGRKVIDSGDAGKVFPTNGRDVAIEFKPFDLPDVAAAIRSSGEGILETTRNGEAIVVAYVRLDAVGWYYVVEVDASTLGVR
jgi:hypothetical protein